LKVETERTLAGTLKDLIVNYSGSLDADIVGKILSSGVIATSFTIPAADTGQEVQFTNKELLARFTSFPMEKQAELLKCIRKAMHDNHLCTICIRSDAFSSGKRPIIIKNVYSGVSNHIFGEGILVFS